MKDPNFRRGRYSTAFIERFMAGNLIPDKTDKA